MLSLSLSFSNTTWSSSLDGQVFSVESTNLISLSLPGGEKKRVRLIGIAPPSGSRKANISRRHLHMLLAGKFVTVHYHSLSPKGDILGQVLHGGADINLRMLAVGMARFIAEPGLTEKMRIQYEKAQRTAQRRRMGLW